MDRWDCQCSKSMTSDCFTQGCRGDERAVNKLSDSVYTELGWSARVDKRSSEVLRTVFEAELSSRA